MMNLLIKTDEQNQACLNYAMARKSCAKAKNYILLALTILLFGCKKISNELTPKEVEIDASEQVVEVRATRKIRDYMVNESGAMDTRGESKYLNGILLYDGGWFSMRVNKGNPDSCNLITFKINKNESGAKRKISFRVRSDIFVHSPSGIIIQNAQ